jgi:hypothetical protein
VDGTSRVNVEAKGPETHLFSFAEGEKGWSHGWQMWHEGHRSKAGRFLLNQKALDR